MSNNAAKTKAQKAVRFLALVDDECRKLGGKHLLTREEYLEIVNYCYRDVYGADAGDAPSATAPTA